MTIVESARDAWLRFSPRERLLVALGAIVVAGGIGYVVAWEPMMRDLAATEVAVREVQQRAGAARRTADEIAGLARERRTPRTPDLRAATERGLGAAGVRGDVTAFSVGEGRVRVTFAAIDFDALTRLVDMLGRDEQLFVAEALVAARVVPGSVRAELAFARPALP